MKTAKEHYDALMPEWFVGEDALKCIAMAQTEAYIEGRSELTTITHRNYEATKRRGLINEKTTIEDFVCKVNEEAEEMWYSSNSGKSSIDPSELADIALVCFAMAEHYGIDLVDEMRNKTEFNETRED